MDYLEIDHKISETDRSRQTEDDSQQDDDEDKSTDGPCASNPCGANTNCWNSGERFMCTCNQEKPHGNPYFGCSDCVYDYHCNPR